jgi:hypothetical protein
MTLGESVIAILTVSSVIWVGGWVVRTLWRIGGRNELEELADAQNELDDVRRDLFD